MRDVFCYYKKSVKSVGRSSAVETIVHQDRVLSDYCKTNELKVIKRFSDLGYLGSPLRRSELIQMSKLVEKPKCPVDLLVMYSVFDVTNDIRLNDDLLLENVKRIGNVYFYKQNLSLDYEHFRFVLKGPEAESLPFQKEG